MATVYTQLVRGQPLHGAGQDITPVARVTRLTWPGGRIEWHRPVAVEVQAGDRVRRIPIPDLTRRASVASVVATVVACLMLGGAIASWASRGRPERQTV